MSEAPMHTRGLKKKISNLRLRIAQSKRHLRERALRDEACLEEAGGDVKHEEGNHDVDCKQPRDADATASTAMGNRLKRWVDHARRAVKAYTRR